MRRTTWRDMSSRRREVKNASQYPRGKAVTLATRPANTKIIQTLGGFSEEWV
jgi:hypothetical protein